MSALRPILTAPLFEELDDRLIALLDDLGEDDWQRPTIVPRWNVKQIAAHLLDTALRRLSLDRDRPPTTYAGSAIDAEGLKPLVDGMNARGVAVYGTLSGRVLVSLLRVATRELRDFFLARDPMQPAAWAVSWAGEEHSLNWFDTAREFTERWHHQQQIRLAVARPGILTPRLYGPVLDCFMRALPFAYRAVPSTIGTGVRIRIAGDCGGEWLLRRDDDHWQLVDPAVPLVVIATTTIPQDLAWQIFTKAIPASTARSLVSIEGDERLGATVLHLIAIVG